MRIAFVSSHDDGARFGSLRFVTKEFRAIPSMVKPALLRVLTMPSVVVAPDSRMYVAWSQVHREYSDGHVDADILVTRSDDSGLTWTQSTTVNDSRRNDRFMPAMSLLSDGSLGIAFYDRRAGGSSLDVYAAHVRTGPPVHVSPNVQVNAGTSSVWAIPYLPPGSTCFSPGRFFGDYIGAAGCGSRNLCVAWTDTQEQVSGETDVWFARVALPGARTTLEKVRPAQIVHVPAASWVGSTRRSRQSA
jgi:hypothetical protein